MLPFIVATVNGTGKSEPRARVDGGYEIVIDRTFVSLDSAEEYLNASNQMHRYIYGHAALEQVLRVFVSSAPSEKCLKALQVVIRDVTSKDLQAMERIVRLFPDIYVEEV